MNVGLASFADAVAEAGAPVARVEWAPPGGEPGAASALARLVSDPAVDAANKKAFEAYASAEPVLEGIGIAREVVPGMGERMLLHSGPPITWARMGGAMRGAVIGACLLEGWAKDAEAARTMAERGEIAFDPCHHHAAVGPMAGIISPSMPVWMLRNRTHGNRSFSNLNEGLGKVLRYGANSPDVIERLRWMGAKLGPVLERALAAGGPIELKPLIARALHMGDELHNRNVAASSLFVKRIVPGILKADVRMHDAAAAIEFVNGNDFFFLNLAMAACKGMLDAAHGVPGSHHGHRDGAQRHRVRHPRERHRRALVHRAGARPRRALLSRLRPGRRRPRHRRQRDHRDRRPRRLRDGGGTRDRPVRRRHAADRDRATRSRW